MLILSRLRGESILVGTDIVITVVELSPGRVKIGIDAPQGTHIVRTELLAGNQERRDDE